MSDLHNILEDFGAQPMAVSAQGPATGVSEADLEGQKLESFEKGYRAGWDDAVKAQSDDRTRIDSGFGQHLQDLSFTYQEAYGHVMAAVSPLLQDVVDKLLPEIARASLGLHILEQLEAHAQQIGREEVQIAVNPTRIEAVNALIGEDLAFPVRVVEDDTLGEDQADLRFGGHEKQLDLGELTTSVTEAIEGFAHENQRKRAHG